jgi:hypothetical protein
MNHFRPTVLTVAALTWLALCPGIAGAAIGVGTTTPEIVIDQDVQPGGIYRLPAIPVINTGTVRSDFKVFADRASQQSVHFADPKWITVAPKTISLEAGESGLVNATMKVPLRARPGEYQALLVAQPIALGAGANTPNIQVGTKVMFRIAESNLLIGLYWRIRSLLEIWAPWSYIVLAAVTVLVLSFIIVRRYRVSLVVTRRRS